MWDATTEFHHQEPVGHCDPVQLVTFSPNSRLIASATGVNSGVSDYTVKIWNTTTGSLENTLKDHRSYVVSVVFCHDSRLIASGSWDHTVNVWDTTTGSLQQTFAGHSDSVKSVAFSHDSKLKASVSRDNPSKSGI